MVSNRTKEDVTYTVEISAQWLAGLLNNFLFYIYIDVYSYIYMCIYIHIFTFERRLSMDVKHSFRAVLSVERVFQIKQNYRKYLTVIEP